MTSKPDMTDMNKEHEALQTYLKDCEAHAIVPDVGGAWHAAFQAGRASLAASAGSEPVASRAFLERALSAMEGVIDVADRQTDEFEALRSCVIDLTLMLFKERSQREARPCHVFTVRKAGPLTEWTPTTMAFALPDGEHALYTHPSPPEGAGWTKAKDQLPPCIDGQLYIGINSAGFACMFNAITSDIGGDVHCLYETGEESIDMMGCLDIWQPFNPPAPPASEAKGA